MPNIFLMGHAGGMKVLKPLSEQLAEAGHATRLHDNSGPPRALAGWEHADLLLSIASRCDAEDIAAAPRLRGIVTPTIGVDLIDIAAASQHGVLVANGDLPENQVSMAESMFMLMIAGLYDLHGSERTLWPGQPDPPPHRRMVRGKRVGLIGYGHIARTLIGLFSGWHVDLRVATRFPDERRDIEFLPLEEVLETSDVLIITASLSDATRHLLNRERLSLVRSCLLFVNAARGGIVEEDALVEALASGRIRKAMLDVFEVEPLPLDSPLRKLSNVVLTPHNVGHTKELIEAMPALAFRNVTDMLAWRPPASTRNREIINKWLERRALLDSPPASGGL